MSFGIGISSPAAWIVLTGEEQCDEHAQRILNSDTSLPPPPPSIKAPSPEVQLENWKTFVMPLVGKVCPELPILTDIVSIHPLSMPSSSSLFKFEHITEEESKRRRQAVLDKMNEGLQEGEILKKYCYGGMLAERGGWFVIHKDTPHLVRRYCQTRMS